jgi:hypothetical protein
MPGVTVDRSQIICGLNSVAGHDERFIRASMRRMTPLASVDSCGKEILSASEFGKRVPNVFSTKELKDLVSIDGTVPVRSIKSCFYDLNHPPAPSAPCPP